MDSLELTADFFYPTESQKRARMKDHHSFGESYYLAQARKRRMRCILKMKALVISMDFKHRVIQIAGFLAIIVGCCFGLILIRLLVLGNVVSAEALMNVLFLSALGGYLLYVGVRAMSFAKGKLRPKPRIRWGGILVASWFFYSSVLDYVDPSALKGPIKTFGPTNEAQAMGYNTARALFLIGSVCWICWEFGKGFRKGNADAKGA